MITGGKRPEYASTKGADGSLTVTTPDKPTEVKLWQAHSDTRDFRVELIGNAYTSSVLQRQADGSYVAQIAKPEKGFTAFFVELTFDSGLASAPFNFSTEVSIVPDVLPFNGGGGGEVQGYTATPTSRPSPEKSQRADKTADA